MPLPLASMMDRLCSVPPQTLGIVRPALLATSTNITGEAAGEPGPVDAVSRDRRHRQSGVVSASSTVLPRTTSVDPRKRRRGTFILLAAWAPSEAGARQSNPFFFIA